LLNTKKSLNKLFKSLSIKRNDNIFLHSNLAPYIHTKNKDYSYKKFLNQLISTLGKNGTIVVPTYNYDFAKGKIFDQKKSLSQVGDFTNFLLKKYPDKRTNNPIFSHLIFGKLYEELYHSDNTNMFGNKSIFSKLRKHNFKILCFCCSPATMTYMHFIETSLKVDYRFNKIFTGKIKDKKKILKVKINYNVGKKNIDYSIKETNLFKLIDRKNFLEKPYGRFSCYLVKINYLFKILSNKMRKNQRFLINYDNNTKRN